jgi:hypothetical protein
MGSGADVGAALGAEACDEVAEGKERGVGAANADPASRVALVGTSLGPESGADVGAALGAEACEELGVIVAGFEGAGLVVQAASKTRDRSRKVRMAEKAPE